MKGKKMVLYKVIQKTLRKLIDLHMTCWLWAYKHEKAVKKRKRI